MMALKAMNRICQALGKSRWWGWMVDPRFSGVCCSLNQSSFAMAWICIHTGRPSATRIIFVV